MLIKWPYNQVSAVQALKNCVHDAFLISAFSTATVHRNVANIGHNSRKHLHNGPNPLWLSGSGPTRKKEVGQRKTTIKPQSGEWLSKKKSNRSKAAI